MGIATAISELSKDQSTKVGALVVDEKKGPLTWGYNGFPMGIDDAKAERHERPAKYKWTEHAERNAIYMAARSGIRLAGGHIYVTKLIVCTDCARAIIQSGITRVYLEASAFDPDNPRAAAWIHEWKIVEEMFKEAGIEVVVIGNG